MYVEGYFWNCLDNTFIMEEQKPFLAEFAIVIDWRVVHRNLVRNEMLNF